MDIQTLEIVKKANRLVNELGTRNPHRMARELGIAVIRWILSGSVVHIKF